MATTRENSMALSIAKTITMLPAEYDQEEVLEKVVKMYFATRYKARLGWTFIQLSHAFENFFLERWRALKSWLNVR